MATFIQAPRRNYRYRGSGTSYTAPDYMALLKQKAIDQRLTNKEQAEARVELAKVTAELKAEAKEAEFSSKKQISDATAAALQSRLETQTNSTHIENQLKRAAALESEKRKPSVTRKIIGPDQSEITLHLTKAESDAMDAKILAEKNAPEIERLTAEKEALASDIANKGPQGWWGKDLRKELDKVDDQLKALQPPADLLGASDIVPSVAAAPSAPVLQTRSPAAISGVSSMTGPGWAPPTPQGIIGTTDRNTFADLGNPETARATKGMNREQLNAWAIENNRPRTSPAGIQPGYNPAHGSFQAPPNILSSPAGIQPGYNPALGSFQSPPVAAPVAAAPLVAPSNLLGSSPMLGPGRDSAPVPQDVPMAPFTPDLPPADAPIAEFKPTRFKTAQEVRDAYRAKKISKESAQSILTDEFGDEFDTK